MEQQSFIFLIINASIVWAVLAGGLMWLCRSKLLVVAILLAPYVMGSAFHHIAGMPELIGFYGTSMLYGALGIVFGILYADYQRTLRYFQKASKLAFLARGGITLSSMYLVSFFGQKIIFNNPMVELVLGFIKGGSQAKEIASRVDADGAMTAAVCIIASFGVLAFNKFREQKNLQVESEKSKELEVL